MIGSGRYSIIIYRKKQERDRVKDKSRLNPNNIWNKEDFWICGTGKKNRLLAYAKYFGKLQRVKCRKIFPAEPKKPSTSC